MSLWVAHPPPHRHRPSTPTINHQPSTINHKNSSYQSKKHLHGNTRKSLVSLWAGEWRHTIRNGRITTQSCTRGLGNSNDHQSWRCFLFSLFCALSLPIQVIVIYYCCYDTKSKNQITNNNNMSDYKVLQKLPLQMTSYPRPLGFPPVCSRCRCSNNKNRNCYQVFVLYLTRKNKIVQKQRLHPR